MPGWWNWRDTGDLKSPTLETLQVRILFPALNVEQIADKNLSLVYVELSYIIGDKYEKMLKMLKRIQNSCCH